MVIKDSNRKSSVGRKISLILEKHYKIKVTLRLLVYVMVIGIISLTSIYLGMILHKKGVASVMREIVQARAVIVSHYLKSITASPEYFQIDIKYTDYRRLAYKRKQALDMGYLFSDSSDYVPAVIRYNNKSYKVNLRLKGDNTDHLKGDKWSFRVVVKGDNTICGMKQFSLHNPSTRRYINEWIYHQALKREGIIALRYKFIKIIVNGKNLGIYALEEHFEKRLIENNKYREGPIVRFNEDFYWRQALSFDELGVSQFNNSGSYLSSDIDSFQTNKMLADSLSFEQYMTACSLLESFRQGTLETSDVFNIKKLAKYFALSDVFGGQHALEWINARFYYNPITSKLEPIGFDAEAGAQIDSLSATRQAQDREYDKKPYQYYSQMLFSDLDFFKEYIKALEVVSKKEYLDELFIDIDDSIDRNLSIIYKEFPQYQFSKDNFYRNQSFIQAMLDPEKAIHAYFKGRKRNNIYISLGNMQVLPIEVLNISYKDKILYEFDNPKVVKGMLTYKPIQYQEVSFPIVKDAVWQYEFATELNINYRVLGSSNVNSAEVFPWPYFSDSFAGFYLACKDSDISNFKFLAVDKVNHRISIKPGHWDLDKTLVIPEGYIVICREGVTLNLTKSASIISYSPIEFSGSEDGPIKIYSEDSTGGGVLIVGNDQHEESVMENIIFDNLSNPQQKGWRLTGAVTFYETSVRVYSCIFKNNNCEDGLNLVRSRFLIRDAVFQDTLMDALDIDFSDGEVSDSVFVGCGNDGIDISGSVVILNNILVKKCEDKGLSIGESSLVKINGVDVSFSKIAVVSKDMSEVFVNKINVSDCEVGIAVYKKKPEFGPAAITLSDYKLNRITTSYIIEEGSELFIEGESMLSNSKNVMEMIYGESAK